MEAYRHDPFQETGVRFWGNLPLKGPLLHNGGDLRIVNIQDAEASHIDTAETVRLQVYGHEILEEEQEREKISFNQPELSFIVAG